MKEIKAFFLTLISWQKNYNPAYEIMDIGLYHLSLHPIAFRKIFSQNPAIRFEYLNDYNIDENGIIKQNEY